MRVWPLLAAGVMGLNPVDTALAQTPSLTLIPPAPGHVTSFATSISADGRAVAGYSEGSTGSTAFRWTREGGRDDFGAAPGTPPYTVARGLSADGSIIVGSSGLPSGDPPSTAFRLSGGSYQTLGLLPMGNTNSSAYGVSGDGSVIVGQTYPTNGYIRPMRWTEATGMRELALPRAGNIAGWFTGISRDGSTSIAVAGPGAGGSVFDAYTWSESGGWRLLSVPGGTTGEYVSEATGTNFDGSLITGGIRQFGEFSSALLWQHGVPSLLNPIGPEWNMSASGVNDDGSIIVGSGRDVPNSPLEAAVIWQNGQPIVLQTYLTSLGVSIPSGTYLQYCTGVSADGLTISGVALTPDRFLPTAFVVTIPTPGSALATLFGLSVAARRRRR